MESKLEKNTHCTDPYLAFGVWNSDVWQVSELTNQLAYLQDTTNIILSDVGGMQSSIEKTLEEEPVWSRIIP